jgi:hypothetical protein
MAAERTAHATLFAPEKAGGVVRLSLEKPTEVAGR